MNLLSHFFHRRASPAVAARPRLEELEGRDVPTYLAAEFPGYGVWRCQDGGAWQQLTNADATQVAADSRGDVVGEFPGHGVWLYGSGVWRQINYADASGLAIDCDIASDHRLSWFTVTIYVAETFAGHGVWLFHDQTTIDRNSGAILGYIAGVVNELTPSSASALAVNYQGNVLAEFPGYGVWYCQNAGTVWQQWSPSNANSLAMNSSYIVAAFPDYGVWRAQPGFQGWQQLTSSDATAVSVNGGGDVTAAFAGYGVWSYLESANAAAAGWSLGWHQLTPADAYAVGIDYRGNVYGAFRGWGTWFDQVGSWRRLTISDASSFSVGG
jgi:hypothetical protein